jgi:hypothetical protein
VTEAAKDSLIWSSLQFHSEQPLTAFPGAWGGAFRSSGGLSPFKGARQIRPSSNARLRQEQALEPVARRPAFGIEEHISQ